MYLHKSVDRDNGLSKMLTAILKKIVKRVVACQYTCIKQQGNKLIFKDTMTCRCMKGINQFQIF